MTLYQVFQCLNDSLEAEDNLVFNYLIWSAIPYCGTYRSQSHKRAEPIEDVDLGDGFKYVVIGHRQKFRFKRFFFDKDTATMDYQIFVVRSGLEVKRAVEVNIEFGYKENMAFRLK